MLIHGYTEILSGPPGTPERLPDAPGSESIVLAIKMPLLLLLLLLLLWTTLAVALAVCLLGGGPCLALLAVAALARCPQHWLSRFRQQYDPARIL